MHWLAERWRRLRSRRRAELDSGLDQELQFHLDHQIDRNLRAGMTPDEARRQALIRFGGVERTKDDTRDQFRWSAVEAVARDLRYGGRALLRTPGFSVVAALTLALGIGATTAMFSVVNGVLLRPLPYPDGDRLIEVVHEAPGIGIRQLFASPAIYFSYRDHSRVFESIGLWDWDSSPVTVGGRGDPEAIQSLEVTHEVLGILGAAPILGRSFGRTDDVPGSAPTVVISHGYWQRRFGGASPLGEQLIVDGVARQVIGVLPQSFRFFDYPADVFYPLQLDRSTAAFPSFDGRAIARVKTGVTLDQANADVVRIIPILRREFDRSGRGFENAQFGPKLRWLKDTVVGDRGDTLWLLMGTIGLLLVIASANVANLVLVRTEARRPELAVRTALGAGRSAIARVLLTESAILGLTGGVAGVMVAHFSLPLLLSLGSADLPGLMTVRIDGTVLVVALGTSVLATLLFALIPVVRLSARALRLTASLHAGGRSIAGGREGTRARNTLVVSQVALALLLLVGSGLMIRTFYMLRQVDPGFRDPDDVVTFQLTIPLPATIDPNQAGGRPGREQLQMRHAILERLAAVPGVRQAGFSSFNDGLPLDGDGRSAGIAVEGRTRSDNASAVQEIQFVTPGFFETLRTPVIAGRTFEWNDIYQNRPVVLVSNGLARTEWGSAAAALGKRVRFRSTDPWSDVVGVVGDVHHNGLSQAAPDVVALPAVASTTASIVIRSERVGTAGFLEDLRQAIWSIDSGLSMASVQTLGDMYQRSLARTSMTLQLLAITGTMALLLGLIGIYGVVNCAVSERRREIGIRLALGAVPGEVRRMFVRRALVLVAVGSAIGLGAAAGLTRLMASQLFGVSPLDPPTHLAVALLLVASAALASYLAARRASALDPVEVLKGE
jgi:predicted permease